MEINKKLESQSPNSGSDEPKVIAEIRIQNAAFSRVEQFLYEYNSCCLCGTELTHHHVTHFADQRVEQESYCHSCNIRTKKETHGLQ